MAIKERETYLKEEYVLNTKSNEIWKKTLLTNMRVDKCLSISEIEEIIFKDNVEFFIRPEGDFLQPLTQSEFISRWDSEYKKHLNYDGEKSLDEFENGYYYIPELWKLKYGNKLLVLHYHH
jgi:hypothetical protein